MKTRLTELLNIKYPILQGGMAWVAESSLASAVSNAGGLGIIAAGNAPAEWVRDEIRKTRMLTDKPFGINIMLLSPFAEEVAKVVAEEKIKVVTTGAGSPGKYMEMWKAAGIVVIPVVPTSTLARRLERFGADALIAEGCESGGHIGELTTMALIPQIVDSVKIPIIAAGGIGDGRGLAAALMLGADGVQVGTRFLVAKECTVHQNYKNIILEAGDTSTVATGRSTGHPVRVIKNKLARMFIKLEKNGASVKEIEELGRGTLAKASKEGDLERGSFMSGQIAGLVNKEQDCEEIINEMFAEAITNINKARNLYCEAI